MDRSQHVIDSLANRIYQNLLQHSQYVQEKDYYTGSDAARVNKVRTSSYGSRRQCKVGYGSGEWCEKGPGFFEDWLSECDIDEEEGW